MKPTRLTIGQWNNLHQRLSQDHPPSHLMIRSVMRRELGFTVRQHAKWHIPGPNEVVSVHHRDGYYRNCVYLDWYDEVKRTFFMLKYSEYIQNDR
jgi:hypothetical protein